MYRCSVELSVRYDELSQSEHEHASLIDEHTRLRWLNRVMQDHEARASDLNRKVIFSFFLLFS